MQTTVTEQDAQRQQQLAEAEQQRRQQVQEEYTQQKERRAALTEMTLRNTEQQTPTPTQEENDRAKLGILHPDEKAVPNNPEMPPLHAQQAYLASGENKPELVMPQNAQRSGAPAPSVPRRPEPTAERPAPRPTDRS